MPKPTSKESSFAANEHVATGEDYSAINEAFESNTDIKRVHLNKRSLFFDGLPLADISVSVAETSSSKWGLSDPIYKDGALVGRRFIYSQESFLAAIDYGGDHIPLQVTAMGKANVPIDEIKFNGMYKPEYETIELFALYDGVSIVFSFNRSSGDGYVQFGGEHTGWILNEGQSEKVRNSLASIGALAKDQVELTA